jgi:hypothetical protein
MKHLQLFFLLIFFLFLTCCTQKEEEMDYESLVKEEECDDEWNSLDNLEGKNIAADLLPDPQEVLICETLELEAPALR